MKIKKILFPVMLCIAASLIACVNSQNIVTVNSDKQAMQVEDAQHEMNLPLPNRLAFMSGHVHAGLALYRAGESEMGAPHLLHPVSETHAAERVGLDDLGFNGSLFEVVSLALENNQPASEIEPQLKAAEQNLSEVTAKAGGDPKEIINFLMDTVLEEYAIGVKNNKVTDAGEYQDAFGFTVVAIQHAKQLSNQPLVDSLQALLNSWPEAPIPPENPASLEEIEKLVATVKRAL